jgi:multidrug resistance efflux pump
MNMKGFILIGIALVIATFIGAKMLMDSNAAANGKDSTGADVYQLPPMIVCTGYFEVEPGIASLYARQFGGIVKVAAENTHVNEGDVLLQLDDAMATLKAKQAAAQVSAAAIQVKEAELLPKVYKLQVQQQQSSVQSIEKEIEKVEKEKKRQIDLLTADDPNKSKMKQVTEIYDLGIAQLVEKKKAEESKLKQIQLQDAQLKIDQAEADLRAKKLQHDEALEMVKHFKILAPSKGTVLRVHVRKGEVLGPNPRSAAIEFLPALPYIVRAEVLQEWGRLVKEGQAVTIEDDTYKGLEWTGTVKTISKWYAPTRSPVIEPFRYNDVRTLECIITVDESSNMPRYGQRVRAKIKI